MVRVIIERRIKEGRDLEFWEKAAQLRTAALPRTGYVSGETWVDEAEPLRCFVISTWLSMDAWDKWREDPQRKTILREMEALLAEPARTMALRPPQATQVDQHVRIPVA